MAYETAVLKQLEAYTAKHLSRMGGVSPHIRLTDYSVLLAITWYQKRLFGIITETRRWRLLLTGLDSRKVRIKEL
jgi:hypothetical protein